MVNITAGKRLIVALDVDSLEEAGRLAGLLSPRVGMFKIGMRLFNSVGPAAIQLVRDKGAEVFVDLKLHDIPSTVAGAARVLTGHGAAILNVHAAGGRAMMKAAAEAARAEASARGIPRPLVVAVTVLTAIDQAVFNGEMGIPGGIRERVAAWSRMALEAGLDGVVSSPHEIAAVRAACGPEFVIITPGVRPAGDAAGDQKRVMSPGEAARLGASYIVVGRPVITAPDPVKAVEDILAEMESALAD
ncbi:MAG: orotidine-5'-phosphate decarboxylase [Peptococcaceae bacterium]|nr:MAG: orotidine-5'-phosphate decarboxylase [Peptococcaceae bacterium]